MTYRKTDSDEQFAANAASSGWSSSPDQPPCASKAVPVWLYSHSLENGSRLLSQILEEVYHNGLPSDLVVSLPGKPGDAYVAILNTFDTLPALQQSDAHQTLTAGMIHYSRSTMLWKQLPHYNDTPGIHLVLVDWHSANSHVVQQAVVLQEKPLSPREIAEVSKRVLDTHVARHPYDKPVTRQQH